MVLDILEDTTITMAATTTMAGVVLISIHRITTINLILGATATALASTGTITMERNPVSTHGVLRRQIIPLEHLHIIPPNQVQTLLEALVLMVVVVMSKVVKMVPVAPTKDLIMDLSLLQLMAVAVVLSFHLHLQLQAVAAVALSIHLQLQATKATAMALSIHLQLQTVAAVEL